MIKKLLGIIILVSILSLSLASATWIDRLTGFAVIDKKVTNCTDYDGKSVFIQGITNGTDSTGRFVSYNDTCSGDKVPEYFCQDNKIKSKDTKCDAGCNTGACIRPCQDSDNGINATDAGIIKLIKKSAVTYTGETCQNSSVIIEKFCAKKSVKEVKLKCRNDCTNVTVNFEGKNYTSASCTPVLKCLDSDLGKNLTQKGFVSTFYENGSLISNVSEFCTDSKHLVELGCSMRVCSGSGGGPSTYQQIGVAVDLTLLVVTGNPYYLIMLAIDGAGIFFSDDGETCSWAFAPSSAVYDRIHMKTKKCKYGCYDGSCLNEPVESTLQIDGIQTGTSNLED